MIKAHVVSTSLSHVAMEASMWVNGRTTVYCCIHSGTFCHGADGILVGRTKDPGYLRQSKEVHCVGGVFALKLINLHKRYIEWWQRKLGLSDYALLWFVFFKGVLLTLLVVWLIE